MKSIAIIRVLDDPPRDGPTNMARDEALLIMVGRAESPPTLRLYQWDRPTISLGYFQHYDEYEALPPPAGELPVVRRLTGGGAILHDLELTYSLTLPVEHALLGEGPNRLYERVHEGIVRAFGELSVSVAPCGFSDGTGAARGPFFCFARRHCYDVLLGPDKIAGSAQRRTREALLQHGSIVFGNRFDQQPSARLPEEHREAQTDRMRSLLVKHFADVTGLVCESAGRTAQESALAGELVEKYAGDAWMKRT